MKKGLQDAVHEASVSQIVKASDTDAVLGEDASVKIVVKVSCCAPTKETREDALTGGQMNSLQVLVPDEHSAHDTPQHTS